jgi:hypothetical protein
MLNCLQIPEHKTIGRFGYLKITCVRWENVPCLQKRSVPFVFVLFIQPWKETVILRPYASRTLFHGDKNYFYTGTSLFKVNVYYIMYLHGESKCGLLNQFWLGIV